MVDDDTLWQLASDDYGDPGDEERTKTMVEMIAAANHINDPDKLEVGQVLFFPSFD